MTSTLLVPLLLLAQAAFDQLHRAGDISKAIATNHAEIEALELPVLARESLERSVGEVAFQNIDPSGPAFFTMLANPDPTIRGYALRRLFSRPGWHQDEQLTAAVIRLLRSEETDNDSRIDILWLFHFSEVFDQVGDYAYELASQPDDVDLAHRSASVIVNELQERPEGLRDLFDSGVAALRQQAAISLANAEAGPPETRVIAELRSIVIDDELPPWVRGRAIEEIGLRAENRPQNRSILLELLEPEHWFFGAEGAHFEVHSLAPVIFALRDLADDPTVRKKLVALYPQLDNLRSGEREYVEWTLDNALGSDRPYFYGPVEPDS